MNGEWCGLCPPERYSIAEHHTKFRAWRRCKFVSLGLPSALHSHRRGVLNDAATPPLTLQFVWPSRRRREQKTAASSNTHQEVAFFQRPPGAILSFPPPNLPSVPWGAQCDHYDEENRHQAVRTLSRFILPGAARAALAHSPRTSSASMWRSPPGGLNSCGPGRDLRALR